MRAAKVPDPEGGHYVTKEWTNWMVSGKPEVGYKESCNRKRLFRKRDHDGHCFFSYSESNHIAKNID